MKGFATSSEKKSWRLVSDITTTVAATTITISDLLLSSWGELEIEFIPVMDTNAGAGVAHVISFICNGDVTSTNYNNVRLIGTAGAATCTNTNSNSCCPTTTWKAYDRYYLIGNVRLVSTRPTLVFRSSDRSDSSVNTMRIISGSVQCETQTDVTSISFATNSANGFLSGSRIIVRRWYQ